MRVTRNPTDLLPILEANCTNNQGHGVSYLSLGALRGVFSQFLANMDFIEMTGSLLKVES
jgi:hypothetical protein